MTTTDVRGSGQGRRSPDDLSGKATFAGLCAGAFALGIIALLAPHITPRLRWDGGVINQAVVEGYAKGREVLVFLMACIVAPSACVLAVRVSRLRAPGARHHLAIAAPAALLAWPAMVAAGIELGAVLAICGAAYALLTIISLLGRRIASLPATLDRSSSTCAGPPVCRSRISDEEILGCVLLAGIGLSTVVDLGTGDFETLRRLSITRALLGITLVGAVWATAAGVLSLCRWRDEARRIAAAGVFPLGGLVILNVNPSSLTLRITAIGAVIVAGIIAGVMAGKAGAMIRRRASRLLWWVWAPMVLYGACYIHDLRGPIDLYHEGERLTPAAAIAGGAAPYRDVFLWHGLAENGLVPQLGLARHWSVHGVRAVQHAVDPLAMVALYALLAACLGSPLLGTAAAVVAAFTLPPPHGRYWLPFLAYAAMTMWLTGRCRDRRPIGAAGFLVALAVFYSLDGGIAAAVAVAGALAYGATIPHDGATPRRWWRAMGALLCGGLMGAVVPVVYLAGKEALPQFIATSFSIVGGLSDRSSRPYPALPWALVGQGLPGALRLFQSKAIALYLPPLVIVWGLAHLAVRRSLGRPAGSALSLPVVVAGAAAFFRAVIRRPDTDHVLKLLPLVFVVLVVLIQYHAGAMRSARRGAIAHALALALLLFIGLRLTAVDPETAPARILAGRRGTAMEEEDLGSLRELRLARTGPGVVASQETAAWIEHVVEYLRHALGPDEQFYDFLNGGLFYFLADKPCPTRYAQTTYAASGAAQREVIASLAAAGPRLVLFPSGDAEKYGYDWLIHPLRHPLITRYLYRHYVPAALVDDTIILEAADLHVPAGRAVWNFIASTPFAADLGHVPLLLGRLPHDSRLVQRWPASEIASTWVGTRGFTLTRSPEALIPEYAWGRAKALTSPRLLIEPDGGHTVVLRLGSDAGGTARLMFSSARRGTLDNSASVEFYIEEDSAMHTYRIDVGLLPAWVWRGPVTALHVELPDGAGNVRIEFIEVRAYFPEGEEPGALSSVGRPGGGAVLELNPEP